MKVLHVINSLDIGGAQTLLNDSLPEFEKKGVNSVVFVLKPSMEGNFEEQLKSKGIKIVYSKKTNIYSPLQILEIKRQIKKEKYDIIHSHTFPSQYWVSFLKYSYRNCPKLITTEHNTSNRRREKKVFKYIDNFIYKSYRKIICISEGTCKELISWVRNVERKCTVVENGIDLKKFAAADPINKSDIISNYQPGDVIVLMVARLTDQKDHETVIKSALNLPGNIHFVFAGDGEKHKKYAEMINELNLSKQVHLLGAREDIPNMMKTADLFILSSHFEGFGLVVLEAMASNLPVIASEVSGLTDIVKDAGILFEPGNAKQLSDIILDLINNPEKQKSLIKQGEIRSKLFSIEEYVEKQIKVYNSIL